MFLRRTREERRKNREEDYKKALQEVSEWNTRRLLRQRHVSLTKSSIEPFC